MSLRKYERENKALKGKWMEKAWDMVNEGCSKLLHHSKQTKLQWLQDQGQINWDMKLEDISGTKLGDIWKIKLIRL